MWLVTYALRFRYTIAVMVILMALLGLRSASKMSTDILPVIDSQEITLVWSYGGLNPKEMEAKITSFSEIATLNNVDDLLEVRSETTQGAALVKLKFQSYVKAELALAQAIAVSQTILRRMPTGTTPPLILRTSPSSVPILQLVMSSNSMSDAQLFDWARLSLRAQIQSIPGIRVSLPYGGAARQISIDLVPEKLVAMGVTADEVARAIGSQNLTLPSGVLREGEKEWSIALNASPETVDEFLSLPIRAVESRVVQLRDVANVRDGEAQSTSIARLNGQNAVMVAILKLGSASTVDIVDGIFKLLPGIRASAPAGLTVEPIFDQSQLVRESIASVWKEMALVALLVATVVLIFLGSWRSTLIVLVSIPVSLLCAVIGLNAWGATFNLMTLGGLSMAIGILVDNAMVEIENIKRHRAMGKTMVRAILDGAQQVAFPEFVSTLCICMVFLPVLMLTGVAADVLRPMALAVMLAMVASYVLSRTLVPCLALILLPHERDEVQRHDDGLDRSDLSGAVTQRGGGWHQRFESMMDTLANGQSRGLNFLRRHSGLTALLALLSFAAAVPSAMKLAREFFPTPDAGLLRLFVRAPGGTRLEQTATIMAEVHREVRNLIPEAERRFVVENIGASTSVNQAWVPSPAVGVFDSEMMIQLENGHRPTVEYERAIRQMMREKFPQLQAFFRPADATTQTLAGGAGASFEARFIGRDVPGNMALAREFAQKMSQWSGAVDVVFRENVSLPVYAIQLDRLKLAQLGLSQQDAISGLMAALGSGGAVAPSYWADAVTGASYDVQVQVPVKDLVDVNALLQLPLQSQSGAVQVPLSAVATVTTRQQPASVARTTLQPMLTVQANAVGRDLAVMSSQWEQEVQTMRQRQKPGNRIDLGGQSVLMNATYRDLSQGLGLAVLLVFLLMVVNFQSWRLPLAAMSGMPFAVLGALLALLLTATPLSVPALMGMIMVAGVSTANSVLVTSFAREQWLSGVAPQEAAQHAAKTRVRPVMMTAIAMILGVLPMALGWGEGGESNAPLGRAVMGGLLAGTLATLFWVPMVFTWLVRRGYAVKAVDVELDETK